MTAKKNRALFGVLFIMFLCFIILMVFAAYTVNVMKSESSTGFNMKGKSQSIAVVEINGAIMEAMKTIDLLHKAEKDKDTSAIILRINSPGGAVGPTQEIYQEIRRIDQEYTDSKGKSGKPVYASFGSIAASGGYYVGAAAREIYSNPGTLTGSIGVIMQFMDLSELAKKALISKVNIKSGRYKDIGHPFRKMTEEENDLMSGMIKGVHRQFVRDILKLRKNKIKGDIQELAQGQIFSGEDAFRYGLVDHLGGLWEAGRIIHKNLKIKKEFGFKFIKKNEKKGIWKLLENIDEAVTTLRLDSWVNFSPVLMFKL